MNAEQILLAEVEQMRKNPVIMNFVETEAYEKVAAEIRQKLGGGTTAKAVKLLEIRHANIKQRVQQYVAAGLLGCLQAKYGVN